MYYIPIKQLILCQYENDKLEEELYYHFYKTIETSDEVWRPIIETTLDLLDQESNQTNLLYFFEYLEKIQLFFTLTKIEHISKICSIKKNILILADIMAINNDR